jgi:hypothetical protein
MEAEGTLPLGNSKLSHTVRRFISMNAGARFFSMKSWLKHKKSKCCRMFANRHHKHGSCMSLTVKLQKWFDFNYLDRCACFEEVSARITLGTDSWIPLLHTKYSSDSVQFGKHEKSNAHSLKWNTAINSSVLLQHRWHIFAALLARQHYWNRRANGSFQ